MNYFYGHRYNSCILLCTKVVKYYSPQLYFLFSFCFLSYLGPSPTGGAKQRAAEQHRSSQGIIMGEGLPIAEAANFSGRVENPYWAHSMCNPTSTGLLSNRAYRSNLATPVRIFSTKIQTRNLSEITVFLRQRCTNVVPFDSFSQT